MPFSDAQRDAIMRYLGYPAMSAGVQYAAFYPIQSQIDLIGQSAVTQAPVEAILTELATVDAALAASGSSSSSAGGLKKADEVEWYDVTTETISASVDALSRGKMLVRRLAQRMGGPHLICDNYFATALGSLGGEMALG